MRIFDQTLKFLFSGGVLVVFGLLYFVEGLVRKKPGWLTFFFRRYLFLELVSVEKTRVFLWVAGVILMMSGLYWCFQMR